MNKITTRSKILLKPIEYNNLLQKATLDTIKPRRLVIDFETASTQIVFCVGSTVNGQYNQFKQKTLAKNKEEDILNILGIDFNILQDNILNFIEGEINATTGNPDNKV